MNAIQKATHRLWDKSWRWSMDKYDRPTTWSDFLLAIHLLSCGKPVTWKITFSAKDKKK